MFIVHLEGQSIYYESTRSWKPLEDFSLLNSSCRLHQYDSQVIGYDYYFPISLLWDATVTISPSKCTLVLRCSLHTQSTWLECLGNQASKGLVLETNQQIKEALLQTREGQRNACCETHTQSPPIFLLQRIHLWNQSSGLGDAFLGALKKSSFFKNANHLPGSQIWKVMDMASCLIKLFASVWILCYFLLNQEVGRT